MAGLVPAIHVFMSGEKEDVDARHQAGQACLAMLVSCARFEPLLVTSPAFS
jgi:hypothetical protein